MGKATQVEITVSVRHRDDDFNLVGSGANHSTTVSVEEFDAALKRVWDAAGWEAKLTRPAGRRAFARALLMHVDELLRGKHVGKDV